MTAPMTAERRREIEATHLSGMNAVWPGTDAARDVLDLLAEIDRLTAERDAAVAVAVMAERAELITAFQATANHYLNQADEQRKNINPGAYSQIAAGLDNAAAVLDGAIYVIRSRPAPAPAVEGRTP